MVSKWGLPISRVISNAISLFRSVIRSPTRFRISPRFGAGVRRHASNAFLAASTARATSSWLEDGNAPTKSLWRAGFRLSNVSPEAAGTQAPSM